MAADALAHCVAKSIRTCQLNGFSLFRDEDGCYKPMLYVIYIARNGLTGLEFMFFKYYGPSC